MEVLIVDDGDDDANSLSNGKSLYQPTLDHPSPIFPHSLDHQSVLKSLQRWRKKIKSKKPSLQEYIVMECGKVLYSTTKKGKMLEIEI